MYETDCWKGAFINDLVRDLGFKSYLELGIAGASTWNAVACANKVGVDNNPAIQIAGVIHNTTDEYFESLHASVKFDIAFIDAHHEKHQVRRDFLNCWKHLHTNGMIMMHDINPPTMENALETACGNCFEFWIDLVKSCRSNVGCFKGRVSAGEYDTIGLYFKTNEALNAQELLCMDYGYDYFHCNRDAYVTQVELTYENIVARFSKP